MASARNAVRLIDIIIANYYKTHNNQQKLAILIYHKATLHALRQKVTNVTKFPRVPA